MNHAGSSASWASTLGRGVAAGLGGTVVMTAFQRLVEMPLSGRRESYQPAALIEKLSGARPRDKARRRLNYGAHFAVGAGWGAAHGAIARSGHLAGPAAVATTFGALWPADATAMVALGLGEPPWRWSPRELAIDVIDKLILAAATGAAFDRLASRRRTGS